MLSLAEIPLSNSGLIGSLKDLNPTRVSSFRKTLFVILIGGYYSACSN